MVGGSGGGGTYGKGTHSRSVPLTQRGFELLSPTSQQSALTTRTLAGHFPEHSPLEADSLGEDEWGQKEQNKSGEG